MNGNGGYRRERDTVSSMPYVPRHKLRVTVLVSVLAFTVMPIVVTALFLFATTTAKDQSRKAYRYGCVRDNRFADSITAGTGEAIKRAQTALDAAVKSHAPKEQIDAARFNRDRLIAQRAYYRSLLPHTDCEEYPPGTAPPSPTIPKILLTPTSTVKP